MTANPFQIENCDEFYLQPQIEFEKIKQFSTEMNGSCNDLEPFEFSREVSNGTILAAPYHDPFDQEVEYHRAKILYMIKENGGDTEFMVSGVDSIEQHNFIHSRAIFFLIRRFNSLTSGTRRRAN